MKTINTVKDIEQMNETEFRTTFAPDFECITVKGFKVYLVDLSGHYGYSKIVFGNERMIVYANDYELHHNWKPHTREELREKYIKGAEIRLFTESELSEPLKSYNDYEMRRKYIMELLPLTGDFMSIFCYCANDEERKKREAEKANHPVVCHPALGFFSNEYSELAAKIETLYNQLCKQREDVANNYEYQKSAFYYELGNHEYHINSQGDWDTLSAFGDIEYHGQGKEAREMYYNDLEFTETQRRAFEDARKEFLNDAIKNDWY